MICRLLVQLVALK